MIIKTTLLLSLLLANLLSPAFSDCHSKANLVKVEEDVFLRPGQHAVGFEADNIANVGFIIGEECVAVIDTGGSYEEGLALSCAIKQITDKSVCYVINTHVHPDHILGNLAFKNASTQFIGHANLARAIAILGPTYLQRASQQAGRQLSEQHLISPDITVDTTKVIDLGNRRLTIRAHPVAHTDTDISIYDANHNVLWLGDLLFMALWYAGSHLIGEQLLPSPQLVVIRLIEEIVSESLFYHTGVTLIRVLLSFSIAMSVGIAIGLAMGINKKVNLLFDPWLLFFLNIPALVIIILAYIWAGLTEVAAISAVAINKIPNVVVTIREGVRTLDPQIQNMARVFQLSGYKRLRHIILPQLLPYIAIAARSGIALIWKIVLVVELLGRNNGVGFQLHLYFQLFDIASIIAWAFTFIIIMQLVDFFILQPLENYANRWR